MDDSATDAMNFYSSSGWDTTWTLRSRKVDVRFTLDPKQLFGNPEIFSPEDLKIYAEMGILGGDKGKDSLLFGFEDPEYFDMNPDPTMLHRMPFLLGINVPVFNISNLLSHEMVWPFKLLLYSSLPYTIWDLASLEMEWFKSPYSNDWWGGKDGAPSPVPYDISWDPEWDRIYRRRDNFKWTVYLKKSISKFDIITIFANDHTIYQTYNAETHPNTEQSLRKRKDWHWYLKFNYNL